MKQRVLKVFGAAALVTAGIWIGMIVAKPVDADSAITPGTIEDPVVTKSYVDEQIAKLTGGASGSGGGTNTGSGSNGTGSNTGTNGSGTGGSSEGMAPLEVVELGIGQTLMAAAGTEVVVRVGMAIAYSSDTNGISDVTEGVDIKSGSEVPKEHLIWFPRDGRGIKANPEEIAPLTLLVRGSYTIK
ncbi:hypothetical protein [Paenibacillus sp. HB172176]|uniref:hypothetical protein n=1 Tax=Paenibacillus sp. HB172176 TaxID=2493690 RepID=UPI00143CB6D8|nr:hypothetical protein [Paenibacillus sp. HB172176]